jgi:DNA end-binding protein Ku
MDALRRSIAAEKKPAAKAKKRAQGQSEMLLPISGKKAKEEKPVARPASKQRKVG